MAELKNLPYPYLPLFRYCVTPTLELPLLQILQTLALEAQFVDLGAAVADTPGWASEVAHAGVQMAAMSSVRRGRTRNENMMEEIHVGHTLSQQIPCQNVTIAVRSAVTLMINSPHFFLPFPPAPTILYRVLQCTSAFEHHPSQVLELARRRIVDLWNRDTPILSAPLAVVDVGMQCVWLFAVVEETERSMVEAFLHDGLEGNCQICYTFIMTITSNDVQRPSRAPTPYRNSILVSPVAPRCPSPAKTVFRSQLHPHWLPSSPKIHFERYMQNSSAH
jgi:hypothetical protein